jgi:heavy metal translocating P-type ATPase
VDAAAPELCSHCRLPLPSRPYREQREDGPLAFCCFGCLTVFRIVGSTGDAGQASWFLAKLALGTILAGNVMLFQSLLYFGSLPALGAEAVRTASWIMLGLSAAVYLLLGVPMLSAALRAARQGRLVLEALIGLGALFAIAASAWQTLHGGHETYYDSGTMVLVFVVLGQYLDARARQRATEALPPVIERARRLARVEREGREQEVRPEEVRKGELVKVRAGDEVPVDGRVLLGSSDVSEPALTGEPFARLVQPGDRVHSGSVAVDGALTVEASGESETLARRIETWTRQARAQRAPLEIAADRFVGRFIPAVAFVALASALGWGLLRHEWGHGGLAALAVLVVACPCALGIATPMATTISLSRAAARGTLLRGGAVLEALARVRQVAFDKTGTLTRGRPEVVGTQIDPTAGLSEDEIWTLAGALGTAVDHPFSRSLVERAKERGVSIPAAQEARAIPGAGVEGRVAGRTVVLGSPAFLAQRGLEPKVQSAAALPEGSSIVGIAVDGRLAARVALSDPARPEARETVDRLRVMGVRSSLLSGDSEGAVAAVMQAVGLDAAYANLTPSDKPERIRALQAGKGRVAMVGDGINDGPALAAADVGIAFRSATDLARQTADAALLREDLREIPRLLALSRQTVRVIEQNLAWAFAYNVVGIGLAAFGLLRPVLAAAAMVLSSLFVVGNSMRLRREKS